MGFFGQLVFGRGDRPLLEAPAFDRVRPPSGEGAHELWPRPGGWQTLQLQDDEWGTDELRALVEWSGAPACFALVYDSDVAIVAGLAPGGREWEAVLGLDIAAEMGLEPLPDVPAADEAAIAWAGAAGIAAAEQDAVEAVLRWDETFVEDGFTALIDALGFPPAVAPADESEE